MNDDRTIQRVKPWPAPPPELDDLPIQFAEPEPPLVPPVMQPPADKGHDVPDWIVNAVSIALTVVALWCTSMALVSIAQLFGMA